MATGSVTARHLLCLLFCLLPATKAMAADALALFPDPRQVTQRIERGDPVETAIWQQSVLDAISDLVAHVAPRGANGQHPAAAQELLDRYWRERNAVGDRGAAALRGTAMGPAADQAASQAFNQRVLDFAPGPEFADLIFRELLPRELGSQLQPQEQALRAGLRRHQQALQASRLQARLDGKSPQQWSGADHRAALQLLIMQGIEELPPAWQPHASRVAAVPWAVWLLLLSAWLVLGIRRAGSRFGSDPADPDRFLNGPRSYRMDATVGQVIDVHARTSVRETTTYTSETDGFGNTRSVPSTSYTTTEKQRIHLRRPDGTESALDTVNFELPVRVGHQLLDVAAFKGRAKQGHWVFYHIYDMDRTFFTGSLRDVVKMRPRVLIPFVILATWTSVAFLGTNGWYALLAAPILYAIVLKITNNRRLARFRKVYAPKIIEAGRAGIRDDYIAAPGGGGFSRA